MKTTELIKDGQQFNGAKYRSGHEISTYDDGFGPLWISRNSIGINGIVRAQNWEDAYEICEDEFFPEATETMEEIVKEYGFKREHIKVVKDSSVLVATEHCGVGERFERYPEDYPNGTLRPTFVRWVTIETPDPDAWSENELFCEAFGFRNNGPNSTDVLNHGIYSKDLNGDWLDPLTPEMVEELGITLDILSQYDVIVGNIGYVYSGTDETEAQKHFDAYVEQSIGNYGRAAGETVTMMKGDETFREHIGTVAK